MKLLICAGLLLIGLGLMLGCERIEPILDPIERAETKLVIGQVKRIDETKGIWKVSIEIEIKDEKEDRTYICRLRSDQIKPEIHTVIAVEGKNNAEWRGFILILDDCVIIPNNALL